MKRRKIYLNGRFLTQSISGVQRYAANMIMALDKQIQIDYEFIILCPRGRIRELQLSNIQIKKCGSLKGHLWEQIQLPFFVGTNVLVNFCNSAPIFKLSQFVVIHDAAVFRYPKAYSKVFVAWYKFSGYLISFFSRRILTVSRFSQNELMDIFHISKGRISIINPGIAFENQPEDSLIFDKLDLRGRRYFLCVSSLDVKKNFLGVVRSFKNLKEEDNSDLQLIIVGGTNKGIFKEVNLHHSSDIKFTGYLSDAELISLYKKSIAFVYPSFYEGFGLPPLEAMSFGIPVIVSNVASLPEVCESNAIYCNPFDINSITKAMRKVLSGDIDVQILKKEGPIHASKFSYDRSAGELIEILKKDFL